MTTINSKAIRNEVIEMQSQQNVNKGSKDSKSTFKVIALFVGLTALCIVLNHFGLINSSNTY